MSKKLLYHAGIALTLIGFGCAESTAPPTAAGNYDLAIVVPQLNVPQGQLKGQQPNAADVIPPPDGSGGTPDYNQVALLNRYWTDAGFYSQAIGYSQGYMNFSGTDYDETTTVSLDLNGSPLDSRDGESAGSFAWPFSAHDAWVNANIGISGSCGHAISGTSSHKAWNSFFTSNQATLTWGTVIATSDHLPVSQPPCPPPTIDSSVTPGSGGDNGQIDPGTGSNWVICYWEDIYEGGVFQQRIDLGCSPIIVAN